MKVLLCMSLNRLLLGYQRPREFVMPPTLLSRAERLKPFLCLHPPECLAVLDQGCLPVFFQTEFSEIIEHSIEYIFY